MESLHSDPVNRPSSIGSLVRGDILISNFNDAENQQGTGTTIVQESPGGHLSLFAHVNPSQDERAQRHGRPRRTPTDEGTVVRINLASFFGKPPGS